MVADKAVKYRREQTGRSLEQSPVETAHEQPAMRDRLVGGQSARSGHFVSPNVTNTALVTGARGPTSPLATVYAMLQQL